MQDLHYFDPYHIPPDCSPTYKIFSDSRRRVGGTVLEALACCVFPCAWQKNHAISLFLQNLWLRISVWHRCTEKPRFRPQNGGSSVICSQAGGSAVPLGLIGSLGISLHALQESGGFEDIPKSRSPGTPCPRAVPRSHPARRLGCGTPRLRQRTRERLTQQLPGFFCLKDTFSSLARAGLDFHSEKTLNIGGSERGHTEVATHPVSTYETR
ncbi:uncharacterized protein LOC112401266 [Neophocaena asiaeorientalis asiaeorientalis]|uniref:Uncharacterized protein LOC112401266 n=1 Tax=Neophocaena asiaeorientalis asiaeorientalis TaxID=1706337 RepID=A0A341BN43_NEOAA|nr:uncharacterized protein LOC112401266 [Neophocaena asiaeorientalis asiaeorientalis]